MATVKKTLTLSNQLQFDVETNEQWSELVAMQGLIVVDVYSEWCGPCVAMLSTLRKAKVEFGGENLILAVAKADYIDCLQRFRNKSMPTWMFIANGCRVRLFYGANAPQLLTLIKKEFEIEIKSERIVRNKVEDEFGQLLPEEVEKQEEELRIKEENKRVEKEREELEYRESRMKKSDFIMTNIYTNFRPTSLILFYPHVTRESQTIAKYLESKGFQFGEKTLVTISQDKLNDVLYFESENFVTETLLATPTALFLVKTINEELAQNMEFYLRKALFACEDNTDSFADRFVLDVKTDIDETEKNDETEPNVIKVPGMWIPSNRYVTGDWMRVFFAKVAQPYVLPDPEPKERYIIVAFEAYKRYDIKQFLENHQGNEIPCFGFFANFFSDKPVLIAKSFDEYEAEQNNYSECPKLVLKIGRNKDEPLLTLAQYAPIYISANFVKGEQDCSLFFNDNFYDMHKDDTDELLRSSVEIDVN